MSLALGISLIALLDVSLLGLLALVMSRPRRLDPHTTPASARRALLRALHGEDALEDWEEQSSEEPLAA